MEKYLTVQQTSPWALSPPGSTEGRVAGHSSAPPGRPLLPLRLHVLLKGRSPEQAAMPPWTAVHTCLPELPQATAGCWTAAACELQASRPLGGPADVMDGWCVSPHFFVKNAVHLSQTLELKLLPGPWKTFLWCDFHPICPLPSHNTRALCVLSLYNLKHALRGHSASICTRVRGPDV